MTHHLESAGAGNPACVQPALGSLFFYRCCLASISPHTNTHAGKEEESGRCFGTISNLLRNTRRVSPRPGCTWHSACSLSPCLSSACVFSPFACWAPCSPHPSSWVLCMACPPTQCPCGCICSPWAVPQGPPLYLPKLFYVSF